MPALLLFPSVLPSLLFPSFLFSKVMEKKSSLCSHQSAPTSFLFFLVTIILTGGFHFLSSSSHAFTTKSATCGFNPNQTSSHSDAACRLLPVFTISFNSLPHNVRN
ncbi:hypothetical protein ILYODFUR_017952 [Ilyodon furcidens]|uniref:Uncharacterized protein n=1 Tax=Ilyodon furcidens TaxID=33524 RepID=A0ABV0V3Z7_9TELE